MSAALAISAAAAGAVATAVGGLAYATLAPRCTFWGPAIWRGDADAQAVALTFDDGPTPGPTELVLNALGEAGVRAAFFVIGQNVKKYPDLLRSIDAEGHLICNHTWRHPHYAFLRGRCFWEREMRETDEVIEAAIGKRPAFFRPPIGVKTCYVHAAARARQKSIVLWSARGMDGIVTTPQRLLGRFANVSAGDILVMHDGSDPKVPHRDRTSAGKAIKPLVARLRERGLGVVRLDELLKLPGYSVALDRDEPAKQHA